MRSPEKKKGSGADEESPAMDDPFLQESICPVLKGYSTCKYYPTCRSTGWRRSKSMVR